jgi:hypothetical protein
MPPPIYPAILTKANWDTNKGSIAKAPNELGIGPAISTAETSFNKIDWNIPGNPSPRQLRDTPHPILCGLCLAMQVQQPRARAAYEALVTLANVAAGVVSRYERAVTFPKPIIEHVRKIQQAATQLSIPVRDGLDPQLKLLRKARGLAALQSFTVGRLLDNIQLSQHFLQWSRTQLCDLEFEFLMDTHLTTRGQFPTGPRANQMYDKYVHNNKANVSDAAYLNLKRFRDANQLADPPVAVREDVRAAWARAYNEASSMLKQRMSPWRASLRLDTDDSTLLCDVLQA